MLQRIQTVYLFLSAILMATFIMVPSFSQEIGSVIELQFKKFIPTSNTMLLSVSILTVIGALVSVFVFKNRSLQMKIIGSTLLLNVLVLLLTGVWYYNLNSEKIIELSIRWGAILPIISCIFLLLGLNGVRKDHKLVKSLDRLR